MNFSLVKVSGALHARDHIGFEGVPFLKQLVHALRIRTFDVGQSLQISSLAARTQFRLTD